MGAARSEVKRYPIGHFEIYVDPTWQDAIAAQNDFLARRRGAREAPAPERAASGSDG